MKKILIAIPTNKNIETDTFKSIYDLIVPIGYKTELQFFYGYQIDQVRNLIADWGKHYDYLFCVDSDIVMPTDTLERLINADKDIVSGLYIQRKPNQEIIEIYLTNQFGGISNATYSDIAHKGIIEVAACGFGCVLIKSNVLNKIPYPHFYYKSALSINDTVSEDVYFCLKAKEHGFSIWADTSLLLQHIGQTRFVISEVTKIEKSVDEILANFQHIKDTVDLPIQHKQYLHIMHDQQMTRPKVIYDIGSCVLHWTSYAKKVWPNAKIIDFEAMDYVDQFYDGHEIIDYSVGVLTDKDNKEVKYYQDFFNCGGNSYYKENTGVFNETHAVTKIGMTLDTIVKTKNFPYPDLIKIDTQGSELDILSGASECLNHCYDIIVEAQHQDYNIGAPKVQDIIKFLENKGFKLISMFTQTNVDGDYHFKRVR